MDADLLINVVGYGILGAGVLLALTVAAILLWRMLK